MRARPDETDLLEQIRNRLARLVSILRGEEPSVLTQIRDALLRDEPLTVRILFAQPIPKAGAAAAPSHHVFDPSPPLTAAPLEEFPMAFETQIDNTQKVLASVALTKATGEAVPVTGLTVSVVSGTGSFLMTGNDGTPLPVEQVYLVSGDTSGDTVYEANVQNEVRPTTATITLHVVEGVLSVSITFGTPEPKVAVAPPTA